MEDIIQKAKKEFLKVVESDPEDPWNLKSHLTELEKWANKMLQKNPHLDTEIIFLSVWLHDIGHYPITEEDHAIKSERIAREILTRENYPEEKMKQVLHCVRAHRCKDVLPESPEAKLIAFIDSASHLTDKIYLDMVQKGKIKGALEKIKRDYRDLESYPELKRELTPLYEAWIKLIEEYKKIEF